MKVAFATTDGINVDEHFGKAGKFSIYDLKPDGYRFIEIRKFADSGDINALEIGGKGHTGEDKIMIRVERLADCKIVYLTEIGGPAAARLVRNGVMPIKVNEPVSIEESINRLLDTARNSPPPWLQKEFGKRTATRKLKLSE
jgi:nitrogen fixation protein NifX